MKFWPVRVVVILYSFFGYAQQSEVSLLLDSARVLWYKNFDKTNQLLDQAERYLELRNDSSSIRAKLDVLQCRISSCQAFSRFQLWRESLEKTEKVLEDYRTELGEAFSLLQLDNQLSWAIFYVEIQDDSKALPMLVRLQEEFRALPQTSMVCHNAFLITNYLAAIYLRRGENKAAIHQNLAGIPYYDCTEPDSESGYGAVIYRNVGLNYLEMRDFRNAKRYLDQAEKVIQKQLKKNPESITHHALALFESQAYFYRETGNLDSALLSVSKALPFLNLRTVRDEFKGRIALNMAELYSDLKNFDKAVFYLRKAEAHFENGSGQHRVLLAEVFLARAKLFVQQNRVDEALNYCNRSIETLTIGKHPEDHSRYNQKVLSNKLLFNALLEKAGILEKLHEIHKQTYYLKQAVEINQLAIALLDSTSIEFSFDDDRINLTAQGYRAYEEGIRVNHLFYRLTGDEKHLTQVFLLMERSKGILLLENLRKVSRFSGVRDEWLSREKELKAEILAAEKLLFEEETNKRGVSNHLRQRLADLKQKYNKLVDQLKEEAPDYYKIRFDHTVVSTASVQRQLLRPGEALVEFFLGDSTFAVAGFTGSKQYLHVKPLPVDFSNQLSNFRLALLSRADASFKKAAFQWYDFLLKDCLDELGHDVHSLIIVPDGLLGNIPFEVLSTASDDYKCLNDYMAIHYAYSATYLTEQRQRKPDKSKYFFAGFVTSGNPEKGAWLATRDTSLLVLRGAEREVASITELIRSGFSVFNPAVKTDFINHAPHYRVLHLAMHSAVNNVNPMMSEMIFAARDSSERSLTAGDLYSMELTSQLVVLSACNTGVGQLYRGEGIMSFSRAFAYAGVPSAVISLWKIPDEPTSAIMVNFYRHLKKGMPKDRALQRARQEFVRDNPEYAHPYFWSGFILTGTSDPIEFPSGFKWYWFMSGLLAIIVVGYMMQKRLIPGRYLSKSA
ncbi:MAG: CHAT domain-containing protein [Cyclobacteriaceae bacterium]